MSQQIILSTAYLPPIEYLTLISGAKEVFIEKEENYLKQTYRNRCYILSANGPQCLSIPIYLGSRHKTSIKDTRIDYSKRWQQVHLRAIRSSYGSSPYFQYYFEDFESKIMENHVYLIDLNMNLLLLILKIIHLEKKICYTDSFLPSGDYKNDHRFSITPKNDYAYNVKEYHQVFGKETGFVPGLSIIDLIFNAGPDSDSYI